MSTPATRQPRVKAAEARQRILDATERLLATRRYRDLTVDLVMGEARLARTVFYRHFDGLPAVLLALLGDIGEQLAAIVDDEGRDLRQVLDGVVGVYAQHGPLMRAVDEAARLDDEVDRAYRALFAGHVRRTVDALPPEMREVARALHSMNSLYLIETLGRGAGVPPEEVADALWTVWSRTISAGR